MASGDSPPKSEPYEWNDNIQVPAEVLKLWREVGTGIDKSQTVVWKNAVESLEAANRYLACCEQARRFVESYMKHVIGILVEQHPGNIGPHERTCVEESLEFAVIILAQDLGIQLQRKNGECKILNVLALVFNRKKVYYKGSKPNYPNQHQGLPEVRIRMIDTFRTEGGFSRLAEYLKQRIATPIFPSLELLHQVLLAIFDAIASSQSSNPNTNNPTPSNHANSNNRPSEDQPMQPPKEIEDEGILVAQAVMGYVSSFTEEALRKQSGETITTIRYDLQRIFDRLVDVRRKHTYVFYAFWRSLILKLITSQSLPLRLTGWDQLKALIDASGGHRPPPKAYHVSKAGCSFVNGRYNFAAEVTDDRYARRGVEISYERRIPESEKDGGGKCLTLFRCTMRSQQKWWFLSEADEEQPGTDRDIDYYQHKSKEHEETEPPPTGWVTCRNAGVDPPPTLRGIGLMVPKGEEYNTLEHQLAKWSIENKIVELVLGASLHREVVHRSIPLIEFLASMCERDEPGKGMPGGPGPNANCLQKSHLLLAWKTCTSKADAAISDEIYQLLVSILSSLPNGLAIPLLQTVQQSLRDTKRDCLFEVAEFCGALSMSPRDSKTSVGLSSEIRANVLELLWAVLTHPEAHSLKTYDNLKRYVSSELRDEPFGKPHREKFLQSCTQSLQTNTQQQSGGGRVDESTALRMVKLTQFVLDSCPRQEAEQFVTLNRGELASLIFNELISFLQRRKADFTMSPNHVKRLDLGRSTDGKALSERLRILRSVYGVTDPVKLSIVQLQHLWHLCVIPADREEMMVFVASASSFSQSARRTGTTNNGADVSSTQSNHSSSSTDETSLGAAFSDEVRTLVFLELFCSETVNWGELGGSAYQSFQLMFKRLRQSPDTALESSEPSLDALWRICLTAGDESVASQSMKDLLAVYSAMAAVNKTNAWNDGASVGTESMQTDESDNDFGIRVFDCLVKVKQGLDSGDGSSERSAERCLRILNAAVGQDGSSGRSIMTAAVSSLVRLPPDATLADVVGVLPHGLRGQSSYRRISVVAKRTVPQASNHNRQDDREQPSSQRHSTASRFQLDVHPLETLASLKAKVARYCDARVSHVKPFTASGRAVGSGNRTTTGDQSQMSLNVVPEDSTIDQLGIVHGCEMVFVIAHQQNQVSNPQITTKPNSRKSAVLDIHDLFNEKRGAFVDRLFQTLLSVLEALPWRSANRKSVSKCDTHKLVWDLLLAMPTNPGIAERVRVSAGVGTESDSMAVDTPAGAWKSLLDSKSFHRSVYVLQTMDASLQSAPEVLSCLPNEARSRLEQDMRSDALAFREGFIEAGGFDAVVEFFSTFGSGDATKQAQSRMGNAVALRILKCCLFGNSVYQRDRSTTLDDTGSRLLQSLSSAEGLLRSLTAMVVKDEGISTSTISDILKFLRLLFHSPKTSEAFVSLPGKMAEKFVITLLLWEGGPEASRTSSSINTASKVRKNMNDLILTTPLLSRHALPWLVDALDIVEVTSDATAEYFDVMKKLVGTDEEMNRNSVRSSPKKLEALGTAVCKKLSGCPRPSNGLAAVEIATGVLCGCLKLLRALVESGGGRALAVGCSHLLATVNVGKWSEILGGSTARAAVEDRVLIDVMGAIFDGFLSPSGSSSIAICCDKESRQLGFAVVASAARSCKGSEGYLALVTRVNGIVKAAVPYLRHRWGQLGGNDENATRSSIRNPSKYSGLRNQGCTCYMNSFLQQLFMMPELRKEMNASPLPESLRSSGGMARGEDLVGKKISLQWDSGTHYDAMVEAFDKKTGMHTIKYCPLQVAVVGNANHQHVQPDEVNKMAPELPDEFILLEGRPGKETGVFEVVCKDTNAGENTDEGEQTEQGETDEIEESEEESAARRLFEEVQRTFIHLEGSRGRCFDPRAFVEACACLKLEFDVWQQNDASEFAMKLLDRMEITLKRWAPEHFRYLEHTFGLKQTKQKVCKECGLKTNREENLMSIDCQIRGKTDIHEALEAMCEVEYMEGNNKVFCDRCKKNTDTVLRTAISALPDMLILSLKRFDLDYNTFETVKLNSRCAFGPTLNMKRYTLEGIEAKEKGGNDPIPMETDDATGGEISDTLTSLPDEDYEYKLVGVLVHAGVAQGGHYYSFIKDRSDTGEDQDKWYKFDDEDVTPFDPASIEVECFGGKVKQEQKWPNGQVRTVESEQYANALMVFYEKVKPTELPEEEEEDDEEEEEKDKEKRLADLKVPKTSGFDAFEPDVQRSNATHKWQTFLFDTEFQTFLKGLLGLCRLSRREKERMEMELSPPANTNTSKSWQSSIIDMLLTFFLDVLLYSSDKSQVNAWMSMLAETMALDQDSARSFVHNLALRTQKISSNWLRTYVSDCPEQESRYAAVQIFSAAIRSCIRVESEKMALARWSQAWREMKNTYQPRLGMAPLPHNLQLKFQICEDLRLLSNGKASAIGSIFSFLNLMIEVGPRTWRYNADLCVLIRDICTPERNNVSALLRDALNDAEVPARLICLMIRERAPPILRASFPGASVSFEVADTQARAETNPSAHLLPLSGNQMITNDLNTRGPSGGTPVASDFIALLEAVGRIAGSKGLLLAPLVVESTEQSRSGRLNVTLTEHAARALTTIFKEACSNGNPGMDQHDIEVYLQRCGVDSSSIPQQKIIDTLSKYPSTGDGSAGNFLSLEGFLAYYRDTAQSTEVRVRLDLNAFGFRPDLSRRPSEFRGDDINPIEGVCMDCLKNSTSDREKTTKLAEEGLNVFQFFFYAFNASDTLAEYLLASTAVGRDTTPLIVDTLKAMYRAPSAWTGDETRSIASLVLRVLVSIPDDKQQARIAAVMKMRLNSPDREIGLLVAARNFATSRQQQQQYATSDLQYSYERYVDAVQELRKIKAVATWMSENRDVWSWMERDLVSSDEGNSQRRNDYSGHREGTGALIDPRSDTDMHGMHDSEEDDDDDDSRLYDMQKYQGNEKVQVEGAGLEAINGLYIRDGTVENAGKYSKKGLWKGNAEDFSLFRCNLSNNAQQWFISIVPAGVKPGTNADIDFYSAPVDEQKPDRPPSYGWSIANEGLQPGPTVTVRVEGPADDHRRSTWNNNPGEMEDRNQQGGRGHVYI